MKYSNIKYFSTINGDGVRTAVFVSGCDMNPHCDGCFNKIAWDFDHGSEFTEEVIDKVLDSIEPSYCSGLSILGGEPLADLNVDGVRHLIDRFRERFGKEKDIWLWTGHNIDSIGERQIEVVKLCDYVIDGPFIKSLYDKNLKHMGSSNQRLLYIPDYEFKK
jgi:anaerobic ribonucleoside-triphosphate reductase activating protein